MLNATLNAEASERVGCHHGGFMEDVMREGRLGEEDFARCPRTLVPRKRLQAAGIMHAGEGVWGTEELDVLGLKCLEATL